MRKTVLMMVSVLFVIAFVTGNGGKVNADDDAGIDSGATTTRKLVAWFEAAGFQLPPEAGKTLSGTGLADDGTLWELVYDNDCDEDDGWVCWSASCTTYDATQRLNDYSWIQYSTVTVPGGRKIITFYPLLNNMVIQGRAIMDDGTLWVLVSTNTACTCYEWGDTCTPSSTLSDAGYSWNPASPPLPTI